MLESRTVEVGGVPVRYRTAGRGRPVVLIHGLAASGSWWRRNVPALARGHSVYVLDLPRGLAIERAPEWVRSVLQALGVTRPALIGHSMGALIALLCAVRWPDEVDRLVLAAPPVHLAHRTVLGNALPFVRYLCRTPPRLAPILVRDAVRMGPVRFLRTAQQLMSMNTENELGAIRAPTLVLCGDRDALVARSAGETLRRAIPVCELCVLEGAGHVLMFDRSDEFDTAVLKFLNRVPPTTPVSCPAVRAPAHPPPSSG